MNQRMQQLVRSNYRLVWDLMSTVDVAFFRRNSETITNKDILGEGP